MHYWILYAFVMCYNPTALGGCPNGVQLLRPYPVFNTASECQSAVAVIKTQKPPYTYGACFEEK